MFELLSTFMYHHIEDLPKGLASYRHLCMQISAANEVEAEEARSFMATSSPLLGGRSPRRELIRLLFRALQGWDLWLPQ